MTRFRIIRIAAPAAVALALLLGGCDPAGGLEPESDGTTIAFSAVSPLLRDDVMTKSTTDEFISTDPDHPDTFSVFGERVTSTDEHITVFDGVTVTHHYVLSDSEPPTVLQDYWDYESPLRYWDWLSTSDRYDFAAVSPAGHSVNEQAEGLYISTHYDYLTGAPSGGDKYDILAATYRRRGIDNWENRYEQVRLTFSHMGSAVGVTVLNTSQNTSVTVNYLQYKNLVVSADAIVTLDNYGQTILRWVNPYPDGRAVRKLAKAEPTTITHGQEYTGEYQIMIPQNLSLYGAKLVLHYTVNGVEYDAEIPLAEIKRNDGTAITAWEIGCKYTYTVSMRLDGGLLVTVTTTPWDEPVQGETPGILI